MIFHATETRVAAAQYVHRDSGNTTAFDPACTVLHRLCTTVTRRLPAVVAAQATSNPTICTIYILRLEQGFGFPLFLYF